MTSTKCLLISNAKGIGLLYLCILKKDIAVSHKVLVHINEWKDKFHGFIFLVQENVRKSHAARVLEEKAGKVVSAA